MVRVRYCSGATQKEKNLCFWSYAKKWEEELVLKIKWEEQLVWDRLQQRRVWRRISPIKNN
ncbi:hypothetical protein AXI57_09030 [Bacillus atrophaeus]|nr:hypothetical protein AXI57_09030 [Bacillus atrophaeus]